MKPRDRAAPRDGLVRVLIWGVVALALALAWLDTSPIHVESEEALEPGSALVLDAVSDVLLVVDYAAFPQDPASFDELDFSLAWLNTFQQEIGPVALRDAESLPETELGNYRVVVVTRSAAHHEAWLPKLKGYVDRGGTLVVEMPGGVIREAFSADGMGGLRDPQRITMAAGMPQELLAVLQELPLTTRLIGSSGPLEEAETLLTIDGVPVVYRKKMGAGWAITVDFDYGMLLTAVQQGRPTEGFRIRDRRGSSEIETADLVLGESLLESDVPAADVLERFMVYGVLDQAQPMIGFWPFLDGMDGAFVVTHDERGMGDRAAWMAEYEHDFKGSSSYFVRAPGAMTSEGLEHLVGLGVDVALEWNRPLGEGGAFERVGLWGIEPVEKALSLEAQARSLRESYDDLPALVTARSRDHLWGRAWAEPFRALNAAGLLADSSYAPPPGKSGYAFGTGLPFMPLDQTGLAFEVLEFPNVMLARGEEGERERLTQLLADSQKGAHEAIGVSFSPRAFVDEPSALLYETWRDAYRVAAEHGHWITSVRNLYRFSRARHNSELRSRRVDTRLDGGTVLLLRVETLALESGMTLSVPQSIGDKTFAEARRGLNRVQGDELLADKLQPRPVDLMGHHRVLLPLSKGFNAIDVVYE